MGLFDDPRAYYADASGYLRQGDLIIAPSATLWTARERDSASAPLVPPTKVGTTQQTLLWPAQPPAEGVVAEVRWGLAIVLPHECAIHRDFNRRLVELERRDGITGTEAVARASADVSLDPTIVVAPVWPLSTFAEEDRRPIAEGGRIGFFPVCAGPDPSRPLVPPGAVDLGRVTEISRGLVHRRVARLSDRARALLRYKLAQQWAYRNQSLDAEIARAVGHTIVQSQVVERAKGLQITLILDDGSTLVLKQDQRRPGVDDLPGRAPLEDRPIPPRIQ